MGCCSDTNFTSAPDAEIDPSERVNYTFGMVLGVDDFKQEQAWLAGRDERALRETIGYGVLAGLDVHVQPGTDTGSLEIRVSPGLAAAPDGKLISVPSTQCGRLDTWLKGPGLQDPITSGSRTAYLVLAYADRTGTPVPIPGEPCRDESAQQADSRIADGFTLELHWDRPSTEEDDALHNLVVWLRKVEVQDAPDEGTSVSITQFQEAVESLQLTGTDGSTGTWGSAGKLLVIPRSKYQEYLSAAFDVWVRKQRLVHLAKHGPVQLEAGKGTAERSVQLAQLSFALDSGGRLVPSGTPSVLAHVDILGRPQLLHLRFLQDWLLSNAENDAPREAFYVIDREDPRLPNAQNLFSTFFSSDETATQAQTHGPMARVDQVDLNTARITPAQLFGRTDSEDGQAAGDYYGPNMTAPIPVTDGGTGQADRPQNGQILVGIGEGTDESGVHSDGVFTLASVLAKTPEEGASGTANIVVEHDMSYNIVLNTIQDIYREATPTFASVNLTELPSTLLATNSDGKVIAAHVTPKEGGGVVVEIASEADKYEIVLDTVQPLASSSTPTFVSVNLTELPSKLLATNSDGKVIAAHVTPKEGGGVVVEIASEADKYEIVLDTVQPLGPSATPTFVSVNLTEVKGMLLATNSAGTVVGAQPWDGKPINPETPRYYAPGQAAAVRIVDGGTGQQGVPKALQVLVGRNDAAETNENFVLATLVGGRNMSVSLQPPPTDSDSTDWQLMIDFKGRGPGGVEFPLKPVQGGTGLTVEPKAGQVLVGAGDGAYTLTQIEGAGSVTVGVTETGAIALDTTQDLRVGAMPRFENLLLTNPSQGPSTHRLGWNSDSQSIMVEESPTSGVRAIRIIPLGGQVVDDGRLEGEVVVVMGPGGVQLPRPETDGFINGRVLVLKNLQDPALPGPVRPGPVRPDPMLQGTVEILGVGIREQLSLQPGQAVTLIASTQIGQWLVIGRG